MTVTDIDGKTTTTRLQTQLDSGAMVFGLQDSNYNHDKNGTNIKNSNLIFTELTLTAQHQGARHAA